MINLTTNRPGTATLFALSALLFCTAAWDNSPAVAQVELSHPSVIAETPPELPDDFDVLTRGSLHEAFASPHQSNPEASPVIAVAPPEPIDELPPEYKPEGVDVQWIPGYWAWDESQQDHIWISGVWRDAPPRRRWVPGYWDQTNAGFHWVSGFWAEENQQEVNYLPQPPASIDQGPSTVAPSEDHFYVPGSWQFQDERYRWAAGHWHPMEENWIWIPASYVWTPSGCIYQSGYWDYEFDERGTCFAPVHFNRPVYIEADYQYQPSFAINLSVDFLTHLFVRPRYSQYYYGDFYSSNFSNLGFQPWVNYRSHYGGYDPLLAYYGHRRSPFDNRYNTVQYLAQQHRFYFNNQNYRPRPTFAAQFNFNNSFQRQPNRGNYDYVKKSNYVRTYSKHRDINRGNDFRKGQQQRSAYHRIREAELRSSRQRIDQLARLQRERKQREIRLASDVSPRRSANYRPDRGQRNDDFRNAAELARQATTDRNRRERERERRATQTNQRVDRQRRENEQRRQQQLAQQSRRNNTEIRDAQRRADAASRDRDRQRRDEQQRRTSDIARQQRDRQQRATEQARERTREQARVAKVARDRASQRNKSQQDLARRAQQAQRDADRRAKQQGDARRNLVKSQQESARLDAARQRQQKFKQDAARRAQDKSKQDAARRAQESKRNADRQRQQKSKQDAARRANEKSKQESARQRQQKSQQDAARRAQDKNKQAAARRAQESKRNADRQRQQKSKQDAARRAKEKSRQESARRSQQKSQQDAARRAKAKSQQDAARRAREKSAAARKSKSKSKNKKKK